MHKAVITVRYETDDIKSADYGVVCERSFRTPVRAMAYRDYLESMGIFHHWFILETIDEKSIGTWDGASL